ARRVRRDPGRDAAPGSGVMLVRQPNRNLSAQDHSPKRGVTSGFPGVSVEVHQYLRSRGKEVADPQLANGMPWGGREAAGVPFDTPTRCARPPGRCATRQHFVGEVQAWTSLSRAETSRFPTTIERTWPRSCTR